MHRAFVVAAASAMLVGCDAGAPPAPPATETVAAPKPTNQPPPPRYVGRWAASADMCTTGWWRFWNDEVLTGAGEMRCDILPPDAASGDERRRTVCQANGRIDREEWVMTYPADGKMTVARNAGAPVALVKC